MISDWHHFAILELTTLKQFKKSNKWIGQQLGISEKVVAAAVQRLIKVGLLEEKNNTLVATTADSFTTSDIPSKSIKEFHEQILNKAKEAQHLQSVEDREITTLTLGVKKSDLPKAKKMIREFKKLITKELCLLVDDKDAVYALGIQFFELTNKNGGPNETN